MENESNEKLAYDKAEAMMIISKYGKSSPREGGYILHFAEIPDLAADLSRAYSKHSIVITDDRIHQIRVREGVIVLLVLLILLGVGLWAI